MSPTSPLTTSHSKNHLRHKCQQAIKKPLDTSMNHLLQMSTTTSTMDPGVSRMCKKKSLMMKVRT